MKKFSQFINEAISFADPDKDHATNVALGKAYDEMDKQRKVAKEDVFPKLQKLISKYGGKAEWKSQRTFRDSVGYPTFEVTLKKSGTRVRMTEKDNGSLEIDFSISLSKNVKEKISSAWRANTGQALYAMDWHEYVVRDGSVTALELTQKLSDGMVRAIRDMLDTLEA